MTILVTGGAGYIGSHTCKALAAEGLFPVTFDNLSTGHEWAVRWGPLIIGDLCDRELLVRTMQKYRVQAVLHFAASGSVGESVEDPAKYYRNNLINSLNLLDAMRSAKVQRMIFSSTCATYGIPQTDLIDESHPQLPVNPYGETKLAIERALWSYGSAYEMRSISLRYFNAAGADEEGCLGEDHDPETHLIPLAMAAAADSSRFISVFGADYPTPDGTAIRDYIHVSDLADAHVRALQLLLNGAPSDCFNLGSGRGYSVLEVIAAVEQVTGRRIAVKETPRRAGDPPRLVAAAARARTLLDWRARRSALERIVTSAWRWSTRLADVETRKHMLAAEQMKIEPTRMAQMVKHL
jgi:UDP-glucose-4-epimerase GalE